MLKRLLPFLFAFLLPLSAVAQIQPSHHADIVLNSQGKPVPGAIVTVFLAGTMTPASLFSDFAGTILSNPTTADVLGNYNFYIAPGVYDIQISGIGITTTTFFNVEIASSITYKFRGSAFLPVSCGNGEIVYLTSNNTFQFCGNPKIVSQGGYELTSWKIFESSGTFLVRELSSNTDRLSFALVGTNTYATGAASGIHNFTDTFGGTPHVTVNGREVLVRASDDFTTRVSHTGTTTETTLRTVTVPAGLLATNGCFEVIIAGSIVNGGTPGQKDIRLKFDGSLLTLVTRTGSNAQNFVTRGTICNRGATNSQIAAFQGPQADSLSLVGDFTTHSVNTTVSKNITVTGQLANSGDTIHVESVVVTYRIR